MAKRNLEESSLRNSGCILLLLVLLCPPSSVASPPSLLSLLIPWSQGGPWKQATLQPIGDAPPILSREDTNRQMINSFLENGGRKVFSEQMGEDWESPRDPDLFLLTEVNDGESGERSYAEEMEARRVKRTGNMQVGGSRMRTSVGGGLLGAGGGRGSMHGGRMGGPVGGGVSGGPSLSIVNPLDVLRQRLLLEIARRRMRQSEDQILANRELLKSIGKREASNKKATSM